tara:strand:+ start:421 stop:612 length:192 start_codon:yes stop_codon:yes gene_type:complete
VHNDPRQLDRDLNGTLGDVMAEKLRIGATFPTVPLTLTDGRRISLPDELEGSYRAILFYRGYW